MAQEPILTPSRGEIAAVADALAAFLAAYEAVAVPLELAAPRGDLAAVMARAAVLEPLAGLERLLNPEGRPVDAGRECHVAGWPSTIAAAWGEVTWGMRDIIVGWDVPEICDGRRIERRLNRGEALPKYVLYVLTPAQLRRLASARDTLARAVEPPPGETPAQLRTTAEEGTPGDLAASTMAPETRALAAAIKLKLQGNTVSLRAACELAGVDRASLKKHHPDTARAILAMKKPDHVGRRGNHTEPVDEDPEE